jgi:hypothetical protein
MVELRNLVLLGAATLGLSGALSVPSGEARAEEWVGHSVTLAGRKMSCNKADILLDRTLPSEGGAGDTTLILNPVMLNQQPPTVRLFVFTHECGHLTVGDSELDADCWAVGKGVREHWLDKAGLNQVCQSFDGAPETDTHPSAARRCKNLDRCYAKALTEMPPTAPKPVPAVLPKAPVTTTASIPAAKTPDLPMPKPSALGGPKVLSGWRCTDPLDVKTTSKDPIGHVITQDAERAEHCQ